jgi:hypothetical protein
MEIYDTKGIINMVWPRKKEWRKTMEERNLQEGD